MRSRNACVTAGLSNARCVAPGPGHAGLKARGSSRLVWHVTGVGVRAWSTGREHLLDNPTADARGCTRPRLRKPLSPSCRAGPESWTCWTGLPFLQEISRWSTARSAAQASRSAPSASDAGCSGIAPQKRSPWRSSTPRSTRESTSSTPRMCTAVKSGAANRLSARSSKRRATATNLSSPPRCTFPSILRTPTVGASAAAALSRSARKAFAALGPTTSTCTTCTAWTPRCPSTNRCGHSTI